MRLACSKRSPPISALNETWSGRSVDTAVELINAALYVSSRVMPKFPNSPEQSQLNEVSADWGQQPYFLKTKPWEFHCLPESGNAFTSVAPQRNWQELSRTPTPDEDTLEDYWEEDRQVPASGNAHKSTSSANGPNATVSGIASTHAGSGNAHKSTSSANGPNATRSDFASTSTRNVSASNPTANGYAPKTTESGSAPNPTAIANAPNSVTSEHVRPQVSRSPTPVEDTSGWWLGDVSASDNASGSTGTGSGSDSVAEVSRSPTPVEDTSDLWLDDEHYDVSASGNASGSTGSGNGSDSVAELSQSPTPVEDTSDLWWDNEYRDVSGDGNAYTSVVGLSWGPNLDEDTSEGVLDYGYLNLAASANAPNSTGTDNGRNPAGSGSGNDASHTGNGNGYASKSTGSDNALNSIASRMIGRESTPSRSYDVTLRSDIDAYRQRPGRTPNRNSQFEASSPHVDDPYVMLTKDLDRESVMRLICTEESDVLAIRRLVYNAPPAGKRGFYSDFKFHRVKMAAPGRNEDSSNLTRVWIHKNLSFELHPDGRQFRAIVEAPSSGQGGPIVTPFREIANTGFAFVSRRVPTRQIKGKSEGPEGLTYKGTTYDPSQLYYNGATRLFRFVEDLENKKLAERGLESCVSDVLARTVIRSVRHEDAYTPVATGDLDLLMEVMKISEGENSGFCKKLMNMSGHSPKSPPSATTRVFEGLMELNEIRRGERNIAHEQDGIRHLSPLQLEYLFKLDEISREKEKELERFCPMKLDFIKNRELKEFRWQGPYARSFDEIILCLHRRPPRQKTDLKGFTCVLGEKDLQVNDVQDKKVQNKEVQYNIKPWACLMELDRGKSHFILSTLDEEKAFVVTEPHEDPVESSLLNQNMRAWQANLVIQEWQAIRELTEMDCFVHKGALFQKWLYNDEERPSPSPLLLEYALDNAHLVETFFIGKGGDWTDQRSAREIKAVQGVNFKKVPFDWPSDVLDFLKRLQSSSGYLWAHFEEQNAVIALHWDTFLHLRRGRGPESSIYAVTRFRSTEPQVKNVIAMKILQENLLKRVTPGGTTCDLENVLRRRITHAGSFSQKVRRSEGDRPWYDPLEVCLTEGWELRQLSDALKDLKSPNTSDGSRVRYEAYPKSPKEERRSWTEIPEADSGTASASESHEESSE